LISERVRQYNIYLSELGYACQMTRSLFPTFCATDNENLQSGWKRYIASISIGRSHGYRLKVLIGFCELHKYSK